MFTAEQLASTNALCKGTLMDTLGIEFQPSGAGELMATMPVEPRTHQPMGMLHGGATVALAESVGSVGSFLLIDRERQSVVGIEVNANHLKAVRSGSVTATGRLLHKGRTTHVWDVRVTTSSGELVAICRITNLIIDHKS